MKRLVALASLLVSTHCSGAEGGFEGLVALRRQHQRFDPHVNHVYFFLGDSGLDGYLSGVFAGHDHVLAAGDTPLYEVAEERLRVGHFQTVNGDDKAGF